MTTGFDDLTKFRELCYAKGFGQLADACTGNQSGSKSTGRLTISIRKQTLSPTASDAMQCIKDAKTEREALDLIAKLPEPD